MLNGLFHRLRSFAQFVPVERIRFYLLLLVATVAGFMIAFHEFSGSSRGSRSPGREPSSSWWRP